MNGINWLKLEFLLCTGPLVRQLGFVAAACIVYVQQANLGLLVCLKDSCFCFHEGTLYNSCYGERAVISGRIPAVCAEAPGVKLHLMGLQYVRLKMALENCCQSKFT